MHRFWDTDVFLQTGNDVMVISPLGGAIYSFYDGFPKGDHDFLFVFYSYFTSTMHRFQDNDNFLQTGNYTMVMSPVRGAIHTF